LRSLAAVAGFAQRPPIRFTVCTAPTATTGYASST